VANIGPLLSPRKVLTVLRSAPLSDALPDLLEPASTAICVFGFHTLRLSVYPPNAPE
jgi:hypothetical protein